MRFYGRPVKLLAGRSRLMPVVGALGAGQTAAEAMRAGAPLAQGYGRPLVFSKSGEEAGRLRQLVLVMPNGKAAAV